MFESLPDETLGIARERLRLIMEAAAIIAERTRSISKAEDFITTGAGIMLMDSLALRLQTIGENAKKIERIAPEILERHSSVNWNLVIRFRDLIAHHYEKTDYEVVFDICANHIPQLQETVIAMLQELSDDRTEPPPELLGAYSES